jgi:hypothetical protein
MPIQANGTPRIRYNTAEEAIEDHESASAAFEQLDELLEDKDWEAVSQSVNELMSYLSALRVFADEKGKE